MGSAGSDLAMHEINCHFKDDYISHLDVGPCVFS